MTTHENSNRSQTKRKLGRSALLVLALLLVGLRFITLDTDPPLYFIGHGQALLTDPYHLTHHARASSLYDESHPFGVHRWDSFKNSLVSGVSYLVFAIFGVSRISANFAGALLSVTGLLLFLLALFHHRSPGETIIAGALLGLNSLLLFYGRVPMLENGLIFLSGALFYVFLTYGRTLAGQITSGILISLAALAGKLFGALLLAPVALTLLYIYRSRALIPLAWTMLGVAVGAGGYALVFYGGDMSLALSYYSEQTVGMYGYPPGFTSIGNFFRMLLIYGGESGLTGYIPFWFTLTVIAVICLSLSAPKNLRHKNTGEEDPLDMNRMIPVVFCFVWFAAGMAGLSPFYYRPLRYALFLSLPMAALSAVFLYSLREKRLRLQAVNIWGTTLVVFLSFWYLAIQTVIYLAPKGGKFAAGSSFLKPGAFIATLIAGVFWYLFRNARTIKVNSVILAPVGLLLLGLVAHQSNYIYQGLSKPGSHLSEYSANLADILPAEAVITGPYAPTLTIDNELKTVIYMFGLSDVESDLFSKSQITHVAADKSNWQIALSAYPELANATISAQMVIRDVTVHVYRVPDISLPLTNYERAMGLFFNNQPDSAYFLFRNFLDKHPHHLLGRLKVTAAAIATGRYEESATELERLANERPNSYFVQGFCQAMYGLLAKKTNSANYRQLSKNSGDRSKWLNPWMPRFGG